MDKNLRETFARRENEGQSVIMFPKSKGFKTHLALIYIVWLHRW